jgi:hypothetical protein
MRNESETSGEKKPAKRQWEPPRGVRLLEFPDRPAMPYGVQWRAIDAQTGERAPKTKSFPTRELQLEFAKEKARDLQRFGTEAPRLDSDEAQGWRTFTAEINGAKLADVLLCWRKFGALITATGPLIKDAIPRYFALRDEEKSWSADAARHARTHLRRFGAKFGEKRFAELNPAELREWLFGRLDGATGKRADVLRDDDGHPIGGHGIKDHRKNASTLCVYAARENWGINANPFEAVKPPKIEDGDPVVVPLRDAFEFFKANANRPVIGRVALEAFGFVRYGTAGRIGKDGLDFDRNGIRMAAKIHKTGQKDGRSRYRQGQPENLWAWLKHAPGACWQMSFLDYREAKRNAFIRAGLRPMDNESKDDAAKIEGLRNIWRHSVISYHLARFQNPGLTQRLAQHASYKQTEDYEGTADAENAARYFMITPETVALTWEQFLALPIPSVTGEQERKAA